MAVNEEQHYDLIVVGAGFASSFFLLKYLQKARRDVRALVLERGPRYSHKQVGENEAALARARRDSFVNANSQKEWVFTLAFGGGSNCWWGVTPRMLPEDFETGSRYGVGVDWPVSYDQLEPYYGEAERIMSVSGPADAPFPRAEPYPQPPHNFNQPDRLLKRAFPDRFFNQPTARARLATPNRGMCCANGVCAHCPVDAKFTVVNELGYLYEDPRVTLASGARVDRVETEGGRAVGVAYTLGGQTAFARGDVIALGANALFNPFILARSGDRHPRLGKGLHEQVGVTVVADLENVSNFQGSTSITGHGYWLYDGARRRDRAAALVETYNIPAYRNVRGKWFNRMQLKVIFEDLPRDDCYVDLDPALDRPRAVYAGRSDYAQRGLDALDSDLQPVLAKLPVEDYAISKPLATEAHIVGGAVMGADPADSIVDDGLRHHRWRNVLALGSGAFPACTPANPTLTICALSLRAADRLFA